MSYFLSKRNRAFGTYLIIYQTVYNPETKASSNVTFKTLGYVKDLISDDIPDPIAYYQNYVEELNSSFKTSKEEKVSSSPVSFNIGYFLLNAIFNSIQVDYDLNIMAMDKKFRFSFPEFIKTMIFCQTVAPSSKLKNAEEIIDSLYNRERLSQDQIYDAINFIGYNYRKYIELFNYHINEIYPRNLNNVYFDCTNYYFEIDMERDDLQKGPSKENRKDPIIGQALLLDSDQIPLCMEMYPGNRSEKKYIRSTIEDMKSRYNIKGKTVQVADKGLNCARNIYSAVKESNDGYVFSKSIRGTNLPNTEKTWVLLPDGYTDYYDNNGKLIYRLKECVDTFQYSFINDEGEKVIFSVKEKRVVSYNPKLATKQKAEIYKQIEKAQSLTSIKTAEKQEYGDAIKYVTFTSKDSSGNKANIIAQLNQAKIQEDLSFAGYNMIVTSEYNKSAKEIYEIYHGLWKIEESFKITKSYLDARPVYLQKKESIYGHFLICYLSLTLLRLIEIKELKNELSTQEIIAFIRSFKITKTRDRYMSNILNTNTLQILKAKFGLSKLDNLYLSEKDLQNLLEYEFVH